MLLYVVVNDDTFFLQMRERIKRTVKGTGKKRGGFTRFGNTNWVIIATENVGQIRMKEVLEV